ncbi:hypothetical protein CJP72_22790 [Citrobacter sp. NCU1]|uniref:YjeJ family protein n=1 Tax=Citrobacter sp. NCU1 TaxID=2026683 RepID=UPI001391F0D0|nr:YjeJ family protein [Citrobacter sp. NCU1]NDO83473.1 hypothetical protein [Citrobacter sp. NCU1]
MALTLTGINTGVIRHGNQFQALALNLRHEQNETSLIFISALQLRDLYIYFEHRLYLQNQRNAKQKAAFKKSQDIAMQAMLKNIPPLTKTQMLEADTRRRVEKLEPHTSHARGFQLAFSLQGGHSLLLQLEDTQIAVVISAISHAINNAGMHKLSLRISSLLDFLPMYDADIKSDGEMKYDNYPYPAWKLAMFTHYLALVYHYTDSNGQDCACGTIVKSRIRGEIKETEAMARRLLAFSPRMKKLEGKPCRITVATLASGAGHFPRERCLKALYQLYQTTLPATAE